MQLVPAPHISTDTTSSTYLRLNNNTYQPNSTKHVDIKRRPPLLGRGVSNLLHRVQRPMVHDERIYASPAVVGELYRFRCKTKVGKIAGENFDMVRTVLVMQLVESGVSPGDEDELVTSREEMVGDGLTDT